MLNDFHRIPDMQEGSKHPKRVFVARLIELEVRLSYHERVKGTIPEGLFNTGVMTELAPGPEYAFAAAGTLPPILIRCPLTHSLLSPVRSSPSCCICLAVASHASKG